MYGLSLALTALNLARHSLTRPRVHVNIFFKKDSLQYLLSLSGGDLPSIGGSSPPFLAAIAETLATPRSLGRRQDCRQC